MEDKTRKEHRRRLRHLYTWWQHKYIDYFENGTRALSDDEMKDPVRFHHTNDRDIIYEGLNVSFVLAFLVSKKTKANGKMSSVSDISKYNDAIKWGAGVAEQRFPTEYEQKINKFMAAYKKEHARAKKEGNVDEKEVDPINYQCQSAYINLQVGCGRNEYICLDTIFVPLSSTWLLAEHQFRIFQTTEKLFVKSGVKDGTASQTYCRQLSEMVKRHFMEARFFLRLSHFHAHGIRKGSGTHASSATTVPPAFTSV
ncbi:hypothetical protein ACHAW5_006670 [Stephanodiscus triporus]|uniref:FACT complex subunit n=1 Tax=Stephanodiscus triporus TaxID=2934178 RepID=A0ABD3MRU2_9STRA